VDLLCECLLSASVGRLRWVNFLIHNYFTHLGGCALLLILLFLYLFPYDGWILCCVINFEFENLLAQKRANNPNSF
jgi:hypothetical protein